MNRLRAALAAAAALIAGGTAIGLALRTAEPSCAFWARVQDEAASQPPNDWFVAVADGFAVPSTAGEYVLGNCGAQGCRLSPAGCNVDIDYSAERSGSLGGWRLYRLQGPRYFARAWRELASTEPASVKFFRSWKDLGADCIATGRTAAQCRAIIASVPGVCWRRGAQYCRDGLLYGPGLGGVDSAGNLVTCSPQAGDVPYPCDDGGRGAEWADRAVVDAFPSDEELER